MRKKKASTSLIIICDCMLYVHYVHYTHICFMCVNTKRKENFVYVFPGYNTAYNTISAKGVWPFIFFLFYIFFCI